MPDRVLSLTYIASLVAAVVYVLLLPSRGAVIVAVLAGLLVGVLLGSADARAQAADWAGQAKSGVTKLVALGKGLTH